MTWMARRGTVVLVVAIGLLLPALAALQYRWTGELSNLEQLRAKNNLDVAVQRLSIEFDEMLADVYAQYHGRLSASHGDGHEAAARVRAPLPPVVKQALVVTRTPSGAFEVRELTGGQPGAVLPWPAWLDAKPAASAPAGANAALPRVLQSTLLPEVPALVVRRGAQAEWIVVQLDLPRLVNDVLPTMLASCLEGGIPVNYDVLVNRDDDPSQVIYASRAGLEPAAFAEWVNLMPLFGIHSRDLDPGTAQGLMPDAPAHRWRMYMKPQDGALEAAVGAVRQRNLWIGASVLALLALSVALLVASVSRVQRAAQDSLELVARISHELRTPLSTITCAGENLADHVVTSAEDTRQYGRIIQREGRRLHKTISDILLCCRLQTSAATVLDLRPTSVADVIDRAIEDSRVVAADLPVTIERTLEQPLPLVQGDADALRAAVKNLIVNAIKHGQGSPVRVSARGQRGGSVAIEVEDHGPGIPDEDLPRVFDPFYRGRSARDGKVDGSGIGLNIVYQVIRSHGGRVRVARIEPQGTRVTLQVPSLPLTSTATAAESLA